MKLPAAFIQLPLAFDAEVLAAEIAALGEEHWQPHPAGYAGNDFLPLVAVDGKIVNERSMGPMRPTPLLEACPYLMQVLEAIGATWGRSRLMRLAGDAEVSPHVDLGYYWRERMRVHVPVTTSPTVRFLCGSAEINMKAGECWVFDTWRPHRVLNAAKTQRIHLVADTVGGAGFWDLFYAGKASDGVAPGWAPRPVPPRTGAAEPRLDFEAVNLPTIMSPWELRDHVNFLLREARQGPALPEAAKALMRFQRVWHSLWAVYGDDEAGLPRYQAALEEAVRALQLARADQVMLQNDVSLMLALQPMVLQTAIGQRAAASVIEDRDSWKGAPPAAAGVAGSAVPPGRDPEFDRPVFVVSPPRSGSSLTFETLARAPGVYTIGGESHELIEGDGALHPAARGYESNRLTADQATPQTVAAVRARFRAALKDRGGAPAPAGPVRMLEKTPKNALRLPFLMKAFPEARFVYLYRDPREVLSSMLEAWSSGGFRTYPQLPGWTRAEGWSLLLTPGWRELVHKPLAEVVAHQWATTTRILLDDLEALPAERWSVTRYDALTADPEAEVRRLCALLDYGWDQSLAGGLPYSRHTLSKPEAGKWRRHEAQIAAVWPVVAEQADRAARLAEAKVRAAA